MATHLEMSDDDFLKQPAPSGPVETNGDPALSQEPAPAGDPKPEDQPAEVPADKPGGEQVEQPKVEEKPQADPDPATPPAADPPAPTAPTTPAAAQVDPKDPKSAEPDPNKPAESGQTVTNFEEAYQKIMAPFRANGKEIKLKSPEEAIQLMQMGANYTRKLQELAPVRKIISMVQTHGIDEAKLSFFIDLDKKDPEAIKKLIKDSGLDPLEIDTSTEPAYREGSHAISDAEVNFRTQLDEVSSTDTGKQTLQVIEKWDDASKDMLWQHPEVMSIIHTQRENGIYDAITTELDRQKTLGQLPATMPFLEAYHKVGDQLHAAKAFDNLGGVAKPGIETVKDPVAPKPDPTVVTTRPATPRPDVEGSDKVEATQAPRSGAGTAAVAPNFLAMSDEEFLKAGRLPS